MKYIKIRLPSKTFTSFVEISHRVTVKLCESAIPWGTVSLSVVIVGFEPRVDHPVGCETSALLRYPLRWRHRVSTLVSSPSMSIPLASPLLSGKTIGLRFRSRTLRCETFVLRRERRVHSMHSIIEMRIRAWKSKYVILQNEGLFPN